MTYKFFDKRFLVFPDEDCLGKKVFYADSYRSLLEEVESGNLNRTRTIDGVHKDEVYPFNIDGTNWVLAYYDPAYAAKVAHSQGRTIEYHRKDNSADEWNASTGGVVDEYHYDYRVKPVASVHEYKYVPYDTVSEMLCDNFNVDNIEDIKNCIWVRPKADTSIRFMVTGIGINQVMIDSTWLNPSELLDDYLWDDFTVIGK